MKFYGPMRATHEGPGCGRPFNPTAHCVRLKIVRHSAPNLNLSTCLVRKRTILLRSTSPAPGEALCEAWVGMRFSSTFYFIEIFDAVNAS
jgi:hypothetical protein